LRVQRVSWVYGRGWFRGFPSLNQNRFKDGAPGDLIPIPNPCSLLLSFGHGEALVDFVPVDDVPPGLKILGALVLVLEIVSVLPYVVAEDGVLALAERRILVGGSNDLELAADKDDPSQPEPNCLAVVSLKVFLKASKSPKSALI